MNNVSQRNYDALRSLVDEFVDLDLVKGVLPAHIPQTDLNALLMTVRAALMKGSVFDELTSSSPRFDFFREMAVVSGYSEEELKEFDLKSEGFMDAHGTFFDANVELEDDLYNGNYTYYNEAGFALSTLDEGDE